MSGYLLPAVVVRFFTRPADHVRKISDQLDYLRKSFIIPDSRSPSNHGRLIKALERCPASLPKQWELMVWGVVALTGIVGSQKPTPTAFNIRERAVARHSEFDGARNGSRVQL